MKLHISCCCSSRVFRLGVLYFYLHTIEEVRALTWLDSRRVFRDGLRCIITQQTNKQASKVSQLVWRRSFHSCPLLPNGGWYPSSDVTCHAVEFWLNVIAILGFGVHQAVGLSSQYLFRWRTAFLKVATKRVCPRMTRASNPEREKANNLQI